MTQNTTTAIDELAQNDDVRMVDVSDTDSEVDYVVWVHGDSRTAGPALDPVQFFEAEGLLEIVRSESSEDSDAYHVKLA